MDTRPIGIFDSGVGGLTVLKQLLAHLPGERMVYLGDTARLPYGTKSPETVVRYSLKNAEFLLARDIKYLVVACNTASAVALDVLQERAGVPTVGVIFPGAERAAGITRTGRIGVIGTAATIRSGAYEAAIRARLPRARVCSTACPLFVPLAEEGWTDDAITHRVAARYLRGMRQADVDVLVLGCTHYPLLKGVIAQVMGPGTRLVDSAEEVALRVRAALRAGGETGADTGEPSAQDRALRIFLTDCSPHFLELSELILGFSLSQVETIDVG